ncbi:hypothetical protein ACFE04_023958 [Oxalis oulophora]
MAFLCCLNNDTAEKKHLILSLKINQDWVKTLAKLYKSIEGMAVSYNASGQVASITGKAGPKSVLKGLTKAKATTSVCQFDFNFSQFYDTHQQFYPNIYENGHNFTGPNSSMLPSHQDDSPALALTLMLDTSSEGWVSIMTILSKRIKDVAFSISSEYKQAYISGKGDSKVILKALRKANATASVCRYDHDLGHFYRTNQQFHPNVYGFNNHQYGQNSNKPAYDREGSLMAPSWEIQQVPPSKIQEVVQKPKEESKELVVKSDKK